MRRICLASALLLALGAFAGCSWRADSTYMYSQNQGGNIAASDAIGTGLAQSHRASTASVDAR
jgi:hypothetical protein